MGNSATSVFFSYKVKFTREIPNDFYLSGDRVQGIIQILTNDHDNDLNFKYGPLYVELIGEFQDFKVNNESYVFRRQNTSSKKHFVERIFQ
jgi:hypothetical protein